MRARQTTTFARDAVGRITEVTLPDASRGALAYDAAGNATAVTPPGRPAHQLAFNALGFLASYTAPAVGGASAATSYTYDADGRLTRVARPDATSVDYTYDAGGRLRTVVLPTRTTLYTYDTAGRLASLAAGAETVTYAYDGLLPTQTTWAGTVQGQVAQSYNADFRVQSETVNGANAVNFSYDADGLVVGAGQLSLTRDAATGFATGATLGGVTDAWTYNSFGERTSHRVTRGATTLYDVAYTRDALGRVAQKAEST